MNDNLHPLFQNILKGITPIPNKDTNNKSKKKEKKVDKKLSNISSDMCLHSLCLWETRVPF